MHGAEVVRRIEEQGVVAIVRLDREAPLVDVAAALSAGGVEVLEFTVTTPGGPAGGGGRIGGAGAARAGGCRDGARS